MERYQEAKELVKELRCFRELKDVKRLYKAAGTLGGGNHFIELDRDGQGRMYVVVHTGSRNLGKLVADIYQKQAVKNMSGWDKLMEKQAGMIEEYKAAGRKAELQDAIRELHNSFRMQRPPVPRNSAGSRDSRARTTCTTCGCARDGRKSTGASSWTCL